MSKQVLSINDRGLQYGDGLFETIAVRDGAPRFWPAHYKRLAHGCGKLAIPAPHERTLRKELDLAIAASGIGENDAVAKIIATAGSGPRGYRRPEPMQPAVYISVEKSAKLPRDHYRHGVTTILCDTRLAIQPRLAGIKTLNRLEQVMARAEWQDKVTFEGLMLDTEDRIICGTMSNVFIVFGDGVVTPALNRCGVAGIMRAQIMATISAAGIECEERDVTQDELFLADELFLCNSQFGIVPLSRLARHERPVGSLTRDVMRKLACAGVVECEL